VLDALVAGTGQIAVTGKTSTSGYWFPRQEVLKYFERQHISLPFDDVTIPKLTWEEVKQAVVCGGQDIIAGALPAFRWTGQPIQCGDKRAELIPIYRDELPNGAFVAASHVASDQNLLEEIKIHWEKVIQSLPSGELEEYKVPEQWDFIDANHYASTMPMFRRPDPAEEVLNRRRKVAITAAAVILIACVGAYYWVAARARRV
jgi:hypothetical protein